MIANPQMVFFQTQKNVKKILGVALMLFVVAALLLVPDFAHAAGAGGSGMPWESPLQKVS